MTETAWIRHGDERLPRYTSYPTAPHFGPAVTAADYGEWLAAVPAAAAASLYLHVPFCRAMCWYCGCHTTVARRDGPIADYLAALRAEIALVADRLGRRLAVRHVHLGGGTPTILAPDDFRGLIGLLRARFDVSPAAEIAVEIDPRTLTAEMVAALAAAGVTRASVGVQSFDPAVQRAVNRVQGVEQTAAAVAALRAAGVAGINVDLIYGLPHQTVASCVETLRRCAEMRPDRFSVFGYAHVPGFKKHQRRIDEAALPDAAARRAQADAIADAALAAGYVRVGLDHFALPGDALARALADGTLRRNFQGYTTDPCDTLIGLGASAIGRLPQGYVQNEVVIGDYARRVSRGEPATARGYRLTADDRLRAEAIERLMCDLQVDMAELCARHGTTPAALATALPRLRALAAEGIVRLDGSRVSMAAEARLLVRTAAAAFDAHLAVPGRSFSRAV
ncbi:MAG: oxygen-independent coproporphyrinogen III oxidase [Alphaproteobacteria bacterium]|nr:oxygen-independent coproporphyrinogen III oxidase [Alphaproteobacteria bacterium]